jgi:hypothetical protein
MDATATAYVAAYRALHGQTPVIDKRAARYHVTTATGSFHYSRDELEALTRGLRRMAERA